MIELYKLLCPVFDFIFPPKCIVCGGKPVNEACMALCEKCYERWQTEKESCKKDMYIHCLAYYVPDSSTVCRALILRSKDRYLYHMYDFIANEMSELISCALDYDVYGCVITNIPRRKSKIRVSGVDQSEVISKLIAKKIGCVYADAISRIGGIEQKKLNYSDRYKNAQLSFKINNHKSELIKDRHILLFDDIVTSGASAVICSELLFRNGAERVDIFTIGKTKRVAEFK